MKLDKEQIHFIDTYLQNSKVVYADVRIEMVDHIATAVEEKMDREQLDFYDAFKDFMVLHKTELLEKSEKNFFSWEGLLPFLRFLVQPVMLVFGALLFWLFRNVDVNRY